MMLNLKVASSSRGPMLAPVPLVRKRMKPPALKMLPQRTYTKGMLLSGTFHVAVIFAIIWLPILFPSPVVMDVYDREKSEVVSAYEPLILPLLPKLSASDSGSMGSSPTAPRTPSSAAASAVPLKRDYAGPQEIISDFPHATNRVQTIRRPDLVSPPNLKFPLRLQSIVMLPAPAAPRFAARRSEVQVPIPEATVTLPKLVTVPQPVSTATEPTSTIAVQPTAVSTPVVELQAAPRKAVIVVNAVSAAPDPSIQIPDAQLTGNFVVGPSLGTAAPEKSSAGGNGRSAETVASNNSASASQPYKGSGTGTDVSKGPGGSGSHSADAGSGGAGIAAGTGTGSGSNSAARGGSNSGVTGRSSASGGTGGISISGGVAGRSGTPDSHALPLNRSYGITVISGGSSGGAGRDMGVFDRSETVFSVSIPMADSGGGADWPMQYAMLNHAQPGAGLMTPPFAQKKVAATMASTQIAGEQGPVFISGVIDEAGKLQALRSVRAQDVRSQFAIQALQQWQFLPAQLDGRPVASKVLIGVTVRAGE